ncbi:D-glycero-alpha-D-manno-heptose-1,7-bisphosphate 7-phosphatase [Candidatus Darwinibacter acetoxidans]|jgi:D-glycero-D-manno-heptose 1,7-bisphosphate phosphatase
MSSKSKAVFLDRDGVINKSYGFRPPNNAEELVIFRGVPEAIRRLNEAGYLVFVVTNQGGVGLGYMTQEELDAIHAKLAREVAKGGGRFTEIAACTHKPKEGCPCRKPKPGLILDLAKRYNVDLARSFMVGDRDMDIQAGKAAGTRTILIKSKEKTTEQADYSCPSLLDASHLILELDAAGLACGPFEDGVEG